MGTTMEQAAPELNAANILAQSSASAIYDEKTVPEIIELTRLSLRAQKEGSVTRYAHLRAKRHIAAAQVRRDLERFVDDHAYLADNRAGSRDYNRKQIPVIVRFAQEFGLVGIEDFTAEIAPVFAAWLSSQKCKKGRHKGEFWSARYQNMSLKFARMAWRHFLTQGKVAVNPFTTIRDRREARDEKPVYLLDVEIEKLAAACNLGTGTGCRDYLLLMFGVSVGPRPGELVRVRRCDLEGNRLTITAATSKTHSTREVYLPEDPRQVGRLDRRLEDVLTNYLLWRKGRNPNLKDSDALFVGTAGVALKVNGLGQLLERMADRAEVPRRKVFAYALRHTAAIRAMRSSDADLDYVARMLGHADLNMTRRYLRWLGEDVRKRARQINSLEGLSLPNERVERRPSLQDLQQQAKREGIDRRDLRSLLVHR